MSFPNSSDGKPRELTAPAESPSVTWEEMNFLEQNLLLAAFAEKPLWVPCAGVAEDQDGAPADALREAARRLVDLGLVWFYRLDDGYPDLTPAEVEQLCDDDGLWDANHDACHRFGIYLTESGEEVFPVQRDVIPATG